MIFLGIWLNCSKQCARIARDLCDFQWNFKWFTNCLLDCVFDSDSWFF